MLPIILAAGKGTRMRSELPKTLFRIGGRPMLDHILEGVCAVPELSLPIVIVGYGAEDIKSHLGQGYQYATQPELNGTAGAVKSSLPLIPKTGYVLVLYGDQPFTRPETLEAFARICAEKKPTFIQSVVSLPNFEGWRSVFNSYGRILRDRDGSISNIVEYKNATETERMVTEVNPGLIAVDAAWLHEAIEKIQPSPVTGEFYLTELLAIAKAEGKSIETLNMSAPEALGINSPEDAAFALDVIAEESLSV